MPSGDQQFRVYLYEHAIAILHRRDDFTRLVFDAGYVRDPGRAVLGLRFEENLHGRYAAHLRLPPWFSNLLPEGRLRDWIGQSAGVPVEREMGLLAHVGHDLPGAVRVLPVDQPLPLEAGELRDLVHGKKKDDRDALWRFSLAGVGLKFSMLARGERFSAPALGEGGDWIVKLPEPHHAEVPRNELAMMTLARATGIDVPDVKLVHRDMIDSLPDTVWPPHEEHAYAVRRFDRGERRELIHIEDFAQVRGFYPDEKYKGTFETVASLIYRRRDVEGLREFARRLAFNVMIGNGDAHLKNWSLIYRDRRTPTLAPAYDLVATAIYRPAPLGPEDLGLRFGGSRRFDSVRLSHFAALDERLEAKAGLADVAADLVQRTLAQWPAVEELLPETDGMRATVATLLTDRAAMLLRSRAP
ncbi:type II toxin-antitoxin system HipA family toxin [Pendulispora albinea]|uniref:HipA domain-containing protein n=1 Tax=Pendulispora albinea TaxID=2741071 RepID=A0ABZ2LQQ3_9BACT